MLYKNAHWAITECQLWNWLHYYTVDKSRGFMFTEDDCRELNHIKCKILEHPFSAMHSGASYASTMRVMEYISKHGYDAFRSKFYASL